MSRSPVALIRTLIDRIFPRGALILSVLSFGYFIAGIVRNRIFANTFGAGPELDAYNAAFRIPEIALDVLVAAGLTAPFVPIFTALRHDDEQAANTFGRTVLTAAVLVMSIAVVAIFLAAPWLATQIGAGFDAPTRALYIDLVRINCLAQILFAASICLGEVLVAHRRFLFYALAPILYTGGIIAGTLAGRALDLGIEATAWGAVAGAALHLGIRALGILRTSFRPRPALRVRTPAFKEFVRLMLPRMVSHPIEPAIFTFFTALATTIAVGGVTTINFALDYQVVPVSLVGIAFSLAVFPTLSMAYADGDQSAFRSVLGRNVVTIGGLTTLAAVMLFFGSGILVDVLLGGGEFGPEDVARTATIVAAFAVSVPFDALAYPLSRGLYATHDTIRQVAASFVGFGTVLITSNALVPGLGLLAIPIGYAIGMAVKDALLAAFLIPRVRSIGRSRPTAT
ncbi:MAG TPA: lipid II flippase MurJ [Candidatus Limnocylindrales bacterium]|nr:lipid II flippase MurJ [Candidatus Limnocylindrales bacterium]